VSEQYIATAIEQKISAALVNIIFAPILPLPSLPQHPQIEPQSGK
jgi:hypothetical protein